MASYPVTFQVLFSSSFSQYAVTSTGYAMAYSICQVLGCNYRNVVITYVEGNLGTYTNFLYRAVFWGPNATGLSTAFASTGGAAGTPSARSPES